MDADLVLEGGGVKGIGLVGAYSALQQAGYAFHRIAGTSAGAIVGALIAADITPDELQRVMREIDYGRFEDKGYLDHLWLVGKGASLLFEKGIYEGSYLREWLDQQLAALGVRTFGDLRIEDPGSSLPPERSYRLVVMTSDVTRARLVRLPWDYPQYGLDPDEQSVAGAVRASMSIPFFYEPLRFTSRDAEGKEQTSYMVDGGMLSNFPIEVFDRTDGRPARWPTFGVKLSAKPDAAQRQKYDVHGTFSLARAMLGTMTSFHDQIHIDEPSALARTIFVDTFGVRATDFDIDETVQDLLFDSGFEAAMEFLQGWDFDRYLAEFPHGGVIDIPDLVEDAT
ncbi:MAG TPA: patatin-like phospholipase family protein [Actinomycetota bacterium]|jgi:NTE family protein|nr:patatin-like phospholipase family protein [Actinomycetota bacterium]